MTEIWSNKAVGKMEPTHWLNAGLPQAFHLWGGEALPAKHKKMRRQACTPFSSVTYMYPLNTYQVTQVKRQAHYNCKVTITNAILGSLSRRNWLTIARKCYQKTKAQFAFWYLKSPLRNLKSGINRSAYFDDHADPLAGHHDWRSHHDLPHWETTLKKMKVF